MSAFWLDVRLAIAAAFGLYLLVIALLALAIVLDGWLFRRRLRKREAEESLRTGRIGDQLWAEWARAHDMHKIGRDRDG